MADAGAAAAPQDDDSLSFKRYGQEWRSNRDRYGDIYIIKPSR